MLELILEDGCRHLRVVCSSNLIPSPGQYLLAGDSTDSPLPVPLFYTDSAPQGFIAATSVSNSWNPGLELYLRGPLGRGFTLPLTARRVGLLALDISPGRLKGLIRPALKQDAAVVLVCDSSPDNLPDAVEVQPMSGLNDVIEWADYVAFDVSRENLHQMKEQLGKTNPFQAEKARAALHHKQAQILIHTPIACGAVAECGVCAVMVKSGWKLVCQEGPVFDWSEMDFKVS